MDGHELQYGDVSPLAKRIREALGVGDYDSVRVLLPQFDRTDGRKVFYFPQTVQEFDRLKKTPAAILQDIGLDKWTGREGLWCHWLYPAEWFDCIPDGYPVTDITGKKERFTRATADDDRRFGMLAYGFIRDEQTLEELAVAPEKGDE